MLKVSVIVPVYNAEKYLRRCLDSIVNQTLKEIEVICIDDGSTDNSLEILWNYEKVDKRFKIYVMEKNQGEYVARNKALELAKGKYIQFVDADDYIDDVTLERLFERAEKAQSDMCFFKLAIHQEKDCTKNSVPIGVTGRYKEIYDGKSLLSLFVKNNEFFLYNCLVFYRRFFLEKNDLKYKKMVIGLGGNIILRALCCANTVVVDDGKYYHYCPNDGSVTNRDNQKLLLLVGQIYQYADILKLFAEEPDSSIFEQFLSRQYKKISGGVRGLSEKDESYIEGELEDGFAKLIFRMMTTKSQYISRLSEQDLSIIREASRVIVYGAGYASKDVVELLNKYQIEIMGFAVSDLAKNPRSLFGHHVFELSQLIMYSKEALVVVAANRRHHNQIGENLKKNGFNKIIYLDINI